jgi:hypothetical protein
MAQATDSKWQMEGEDGERQAEFGEEWWCV